MTTADANQITQAELREYIELAGVCSRHNALRKSLTRRLESGAIIEPGDLTADIEFDSKKVFSYAKIASLYGRDFAEQARNEIDATVYRYLKIKDRAGNYARSHSSLQATSVERSQQRGCKYEQ